MSAAAREDARPPISPLRGFVAFVWRLPLPLPPRLRRVCSWCGEVLEAGEPGAETTHTICPPCFADVMAGSAREAAICDNPNS